MKNYWVISDTHFGHANMLKFTKPDGTRVRPEFDNVEQMDEAMIDNWNSVVGEHDRVYHLGDFGMHRKSLHVAGRLNGRIVLVKGNHDTCKLSQYAEYFYDVRAYVIRDGLCMSHIPIREEQLRSGWFNPHGHIHAQEISHPKYINMCVEWHNYTPVAYDELLDTVEFLRKAHGLELKKRKHK